MSDRIFLQSSIDDRDTPVLKIRASSPYNKTCTIEGQTHLERLSVDNITANEIDTHKTKKHVKIIQNKVFKPTLGQLHRCLCVVENRQVVFELPKVSIQAPIQCEILLVNASIQFNTDLSSFDDASYIQTPTGIEWVQPNNEIQCISGRLELNSVLDHCNLKCLWLINGYKIQ